MSNLQLQVMAWRPFCRQCAELNWSHCLATDCPATATVWSLWPCRHAFLMQLQFKILSLLLSWRGSCCWEHSISLI